MVTLIAGVFAYQTYVVNNNEPVDDFDYEDYIPSYAPSYAPEIAVTASPKYVSDAELALTKKFSDSGLQVRSDSLATDSSSGPIGITNNQVLVSDRSVLTTVGNRIIAATPGKTLIYTNWNENITIVLTLTNTGRIVATNGDNSNQIFSIGNGGLGVAPYFLKSIDDEWSVIDSLGNMQTKDIFSLMPFVTSTNTVYNI